MNNFFGIDRIKGESDWEFCWRCIVAKIERQIDCDWQEIIDEFQLGCHIDTLRKSVNVGAFSAYKVAQFYEEKLLNLPKNEESSAEKEIENKKRQLQIERQMLKDERTNLNRLLRTEARWNAIVEMLEEKVEKYEYEPTDYMLSHKYAPSKAEACVLLSDWHIGSDFETFINSFNINIAKVRINYLKESVIEYCELHKVNTLHIEMLGDLVSGIIHLNNRLQNSENIISQIVLTSELLGEFIRDLSRTVPHIKLIYCVGNHGRVNADVKESISEENFEYLIKYYLTIKLENIPNIEWLDNEVTHEMCFFTLDNGRTIASCHGHREKRGSYKFSVKNLTDFSEQYRVDEVHMGHFHNFQIINNVIVNGSLMGCDEYAQNFKYHAQPSQTLRVYDEKGNVISYEIILN